jgi:RNA polymerase sigma factor (sigma-70 family)
MEINPNFSEKAAQDFLLVQRALKNDQKAYAELMVRYKDAIFFMLLKMVNNKEDANDLTVEAFGKAFENLEKYRPEFAFSTWLFKIATNNCIDFIRKRKLKTFSIDETYDTGDGDEVRFDLAAQTLDPEEFMIKKQKSDLMRNIVDKLSPRYKQLVVLRYFEEKSYEEISEELDLPLGTVKAQLFRARDLLLNIMKRGNKIEKI